MTDTSVFAYTAPKPTTKTGKYTLSYFVRDQLPDAQHYDYASYVGNNCWQCFKYFDRAPDDWKTDFEHYQAQLSWGKLA